MTDKDQPALRAVPGDHRRHRRPAVRLRYRIISGAGHFLVQHFGLDDLSLGVAFSSLLFGCVIGSAVAGRVTDRLGRRRILLWVPCCSR